MHNEVTDIIHMSIIPTKHEYEILIHMSGYSTC